MPKVKKQIDKAKNAMRRHEKDPQEMTPDELRNSLTKMEKSLEALKSKRGAMDTEVSDLKDRESEERTKMDSAFAAGDMEKWSKHNSRVVSTKQKLDVTLPERRRKLQEQIKELEDDMEEYEKILADLEYSIQYSAAGPSSYH